MFIEGGAGAGIGALGECGMGEGQHDCSQLKFHLEEERSPEPRLRSLLDLSASSSSPSSSLWLPEPMARPPLTFACGGVAIGCGPGAPDRVIFEATGI